MRQEKVRAMAAEILNCSRNDVWFDPKQADKVKGVMTREDVRGLVKEKVIMKSRGNSQSRARARVQQAKRKKGRKSGLGKRKGTRKARSEKKPRWMISVRSQRKMLRRLRKENPKAVSKSGYRRLYKRIKGGYFKGKNYLKAVVEGKND